MLALVGTKLFELSPLATAALVVEQLPLILCGTAREHSDAVVDLSLETVVTSVVEELHLITERGVTTAEGEGVLFAGACGEAGADLLGATATTGAVLAGVLLPDARRVTGVVLCVSFEGVAMAGAVVAVGDASGTPTHTPTLPLVDT